MDILTVSIAIACCIIIVFIIINQAYNITQRMTTASDRLEYTSFDIDRNVSRNQSAVNLFKTEVNTVLPNANELINNYLPKSEIESSVSTSTVNAGKISATQVLTSGVTNHMTGHLVI